MMSEKPGKIEKPCRIIEGYGNMRLEDITRLLRTTYWAGQRPPEQIEKACQNSMCFGVYLEDEDKLIGFARVISDFATTYYLCDVVIDREYRRNGYGTELISYIESLPVFSNLRGILITRDAHGLYSKFGFDVVNGRFMVKNPAG